MQFDLYNDTNEDNSNVNMNYQNDTRIWGESIHSFWKSSNWNSYAPGKDIRT